MEGTNSNHCSQKIDFLPFCTTFESARSKLQPSLWLDFPWKYVNLDLFPLLRHDTLSTSKLSVSPRNGQHQHFTTHTLAQGKSRQQLILDYAISRQKSIRWSMKPLSACKDFHTCFCWFDSKYKLLGTISSQKQCSDRTGDTVMSQIKAFSPTHWKASDETS